MPAGNSMHKLGLWSGVGLVVADMVGAGVLTTSGFMALELSPSYILLDWTVGGLVALCGALAYAALARQIPRSGGEYRYLSSMIHPAAGYLAGWTSLLVGFSVPVALAGLAAGAYAETVIEGLDGRFLGAGIIALVAVVHASDLQASKWTQDALAVVKALLLVGFVVVGLIAGTNVLPRWGPQDASSPGFPVEPFFTSLIFVMFCYTGWNAATYATEEFEHPRRDVPRSMVIGCSAVMVVYVLVNWIFVTNLTQGDMVQWIDSDTDRITLAHLVMVKLAGPSAAAVMSVIVIIALVSAISAMTLIGPRVYAEMAVDRFLPTAFAAKTGRPPSLSVVLQGGLAVSLVFLSGFRELLTNVSSILAVVAAMTVLSLFNYRRWQPGERPGLLPLAGAIVFAVMSGWMVYYAIDASTTVELAGRPVPTLVLWMAGIVIISIAGYVLTRRVRSEAEPG